MGPQTPTSRKMFRHISDLVRWRSNTVLIDDIDRDTEADVTQAIEEENSRLLALYQDHCVDAAGRTVTELPTENLKLVLEELGLMPRGKQERQAVTAVIAEQSCSEGESLPSIPFDVFAEMVA